MRRKKSKDANETKVLVVGSGMSGLTSAIYLLKAGYDVVLIEKNDKSGGLLQSFVRDGFTFDAGARAILNSGIIHPMLNQLDIELELLESEVSVGVEDTLIGITSKDSLKDYHQMLKRLYPESKEDIDRIIAVIKDVMDDMEVLYGMDNPSFRDVKKDRKYLFRELLPWLPKFLGTMRHIGKMTEPIEDFMAQMTSNQSLIDIIAQHFFKKTPMFFAMGYFYVYLDYIYPKGGTGNLADEIYKKYLELGGKIKFNTEITQVDPASRKITDIDGNVYGYDKLIWSGDLKTLYRRLELNDVNEKDARDIREFADVLETKRGGDSILSLFTAVDLPVSYFTQIANGHVFYTPSREGLGEVHRSKVDDMVENFDNFSKEEVLDWLDDYCQLNTYEISIPAVRDPSLAPEGKTGLVISFLFEYELIKKIQEAGWYESFKAAVEDRMIKVLSDSIYPDLKDKVLFKFSSTPLSIEKQVGSSEGGITGWSFETEVPVVNELKKIAKSVKTPIPSVLQAGQWAYSPAGIPTAILTGWYAAQHIIKNKK